VEPSGLVLNMNTTTPIPVPQWYADGKGGGHYVYPEKKRPPGRPPLPPGERLVVRSIRLRLDQWEKLKSLGTDWLRDKIDRAKEPK
jgi:hypothetical protein